MELKSGENQRGDQKGEDEMEKKWGRRKREKKSMLNCSIVKDVMVKKVSQTVIVLKAYNLVQLFHLKL